VVSQTRAERHRDFERFLTFVDAIVAIAITLLVLPLVELTAGITGHDSVLHLLRDHQPELWSFLLSFVVISRMWFSQHRAIRDVNLLDDRVAQGLVLWTLTIVFLPFPTSLVAKAGSQPTTQILYVGTVGLSMLALALVDRAVIAKPEIRAGATPPSVAPPIVNLAWLGVALVVMLVFPATSYVPLLLLLLDGPSLRVLRKLHGAVTPG
jgi:uncharacterized membrane protein